MALRVLVNVPARVRAGDVVEVRALAQHPMETGYRRGSDGELLPRDLIRQMAARFDGEDVFSAQLHAAVSANPYLVFWLKVPRSGVLTVEWRGDRGVAHVESVRIEAA
ncbi:MAG: thiosulfate oxidation carrier complex protein SoxZ [Rubrivivax sp.]|jgi:sulfur-oxidizing protein SoxZ